MNGLYVRCNDCIHSSMSKDSEAYCKKEYWDDSTNKSKEDNDYDYWDNCKDYVCMKVQVNDYVKGKEYGYIDSSVKEVKGWVDKVTSDDLGAIYFIQADDEYKGSRKTTMFGELGEIEKLEYKERPNAKRKTFKCDDCVHSKISNEVYAVFSNVIVSIPFCNEEHWSGSDGGVVSDYSIWDDCKQYEKIAK